MSDPTESDNNGGDTGDPVDGAGKTAIGIYLVSLTLITVFVIWRSIPSCDPAGFIATRLAPTQALTTGGEQLRISGEGFAHGVTVRIGDRPTVVAVISPFEIAITTPPRPPGRVAVTLIKEGLPPIEIPGGLEYVPTNPVVKSIVPVEALTKGNESLRILGDRFKPGAVVQIDGTDMGPALFVSPSELIVRTPEHKAGVVDIVVSQDKESFTFPGRLQFVDVRSPAPAAPALTSLQVTTIEPSSALAGGGQSITITGGGFTSDTKVRFGGVPARSVTVDSSRFITAVTPMHPPGPVSVIVGNDQSLSSVEGKFSFVCPAAPDKTMVLMVLFAGALGGLVHGLRSLYWYCGEQKLVVNWVPMYLLLPIASAALAFVFYLVIRAGLYQPTAGTSYLLVGLAALVGMFSTQATEKLKAIAEGIFSKAPTGSNPAPAGAPTVSSVTPAFGPKDGGNVVTVSGSGFSTQTTVRFEQALSPKTTFVNATTLKAVVPPRPAGAGVVDVVVKTADKEGFKQKAYKYVLPKGKIAALDPMFGKPAGGDKVKITGEQFAGDVIVWFGEIQGVTPKVVNATTIEVTTPAQAANKVDVRIDAGTELIAFQQEGFEYK